MDDDMLYQQVRGKNEAALGTLVMRIVGASPSRDAVAVTPSLEDAYLLLRHSSLKGDQLIHSSKDCSS